MIYSRTMTIPGGFYRLQVLRYGVFSHPLCLNGFGQARDETRIDYPSQPNGTETALVVASELDDSTRGFSLCLVDIDNVCKLGWIHNDDLEALDAT